MKFILFTSFLAVLVLSCDKEPEPTCSDGIQNQEEVYTDCGGPCSPCPVTYPENGDWGSNLLFGNEDTLILASGNYSLKADVPPGSSLTVWLTSISGDIWFYGTNNGWDIGPLTNSQSFEVANPGTANIILNLNNSDGTAQFDYYENGSSVTKTKVIEWQ